MDFLLYLGVGAIAGILSGLFGIGGGVVIVPILVFTFIAKGFPSDLVMQMAVGTSLATIFVTSLSSVYAHHKKGSVRWDVFKTIMPGLVAGAFLGGYIASAISGSLLQIAFGAFLCLVALQMLLAGPVKSSNAIPVPAVLLAVGTAVGSLSAMFGIGGGTLTVPYLSKHGVEMRYAVATSAACGLPIALFGAATYVGAGLAGEIDVTGAIGYVFVPAWLGIIITSTASARVGVWLAHRLDGAKLKKLFALLALVLGLRFVLINVMKAFAA